MKKLNLLAISTLSVLITSCGGGGGYSGACVGSDAVCNPPKAIVAAPDTVSQVDLPQSPPSRFANMCTIPDQLTWVRSQLDDDYLWYDEIVNLKASDYSTPQAYFNALLVRSKDRFSFTLPQTTADDFFIAGADVGYGHTVVNSGGVLRVAYVEPGSPAAAQNVARGAQFIGINGKPIAQVSAAEQTAALYPSTVGASNQFEIKDVGSNTTRVVTLSSAKVTGTPVLKTSIIPAANNKKIGYIVFNDHNAPAEAPLITTMRQFQQAGIDDLVLDMRYNGGGYLYIAQELASMINGPATKNKTFIQLSYNNKHPELTNSPGSMLSFTSTGQAGQQLPQLTLPRVFVLTGRNTCSASEAVINGLSPFVQVITIGGTSCGKPYGFHQANNCGTAYFAIDFVNKNALAQAVSTTGIAPSCTASDDLDHALGDTNERLLSNAITYSSTGSCPASSVVPRIASQQSAAVLITTEDASPLRQSMLVK